MVAAVASVALSLQYEASFVFSSLVSLPPFDTLSSKPFFSIERVLL